MRYSLAATGEPPLEPSNRLFRNFLFFQVFSSDLSGHVSRLWVLVSHVESLVTLSASSSRGLYREV